MFFDWLDCWWLVSVQSITCLLFRELDKVVELGLFSCMIIGYKGLLDGGKIL